MNRRAFLKQGMAALSVAAPAGRAAAEVKQPPNFVVILADDLGYGDLGCYGSAIRTPNLDRMAREGVLFRQFSAASPVCSPSRASLMTGRYGVRGNVPSVLGPAERTGLSLSEVTLPQALRAAGYATSCIGKWHLGATPAYLPNARGFDEYYGIPYSNDNWPSVLMRNSDTVESPVVQETITQRYTDHAVQFLRRVKNRPFFLYMPHMVPHVPLTASRAFEGKSPFGRYGDAVEELDWSVGQVRAELEAQDLAENTLVLFTSDNGPWFQGSPGRLRGRKGDTFEGGMRVPFLACWPGQIPSGRVVNGFASMLDLLPTLVSLAGGPTPRNPLDGVDVWPLMRGETEAVEHAPFLYFDGYHLQCARVGRWKLHFSRYNGPAFAPPPAGGRFNLRLLNPELYDLEANPEESYSAAAENPDVVLDIRARVEAMLPSFPEPVRAAWRDTLNRPVEGVNEGEWPSPKV